MSIKINNVEYHSYATIEEANKYFLPKYNNNWDNITDFERKSLLITATREIDKMDFQGKVAEEEQPLAFPRIICKICDEPVNPKKELITCCCEIASAIYNLPATNLATPGAENIESMSIGDTSITYKKGATIEVDAFSSISKPIIKKILSKYLKGNIQIIL